MEKLYKTAEEINKELAISQLKQLAGEIRLRNGIGITLFMLKDKISICKVDKETGTEQLKFPYSDIGYQNAAHFLRTPVSIDKDVALKEVV